MMKLLLHICCGPCATVVIERLKGSYDIIGYFSNPNIHPEEEYRRRLEAVRTVCRITGIQLVEDEYDTGAFLDRVKELETEPENGARCVECYCLRLGRTAAVAKEHGIGLFASTLTVGPMKKAAVIDRIGREAGEERDVTFLEGDWKKDDGFRRSCALSKEYGIYRQRYCGCLFSIRGGKRDE